MVKVDSVANERCYLFLLYCKQSLKKEVLALKSGSATGGALAAPSSMILGDLTKEEMAQKLISYQKFMAKYIVEAQQEKMKAVQAAENSTKQKYEGQMLLLKGTASTAAVAVAAPAAATTLYEERSAKVSAAAHAGKSRWSDVENERAAKVAGTAPPSALGGAVNGLQVNGASVPATIPSAETSLFDLRNAMVAAAGKAGKSRWSEVEVARATSLASSLPAAPARPAVAAVPVNVAIEAADHGLRNDGGVGGPSLAERVNLGAQLAKAASLASSLPAASARPAAAAVPVNAAVEAADHGLRNDGGVGGASLAERVNLGAQLATTAPAASAASSGTSLYDKRNAMIAAAGKAGKSRWGELEIHRAQQLVIALPSASAGPVPVPPEVEEADHGLRNDGGVGGPSLAQRINLGAALLG
jgi:hypothetical protein